jgi:tRNA-splicing ligase RtcB
MQVINDIPVWGDPLPEAVEQMKNAYSYSGEKCALMADHHIGYSVPIGGVVAYEGRICPNGIGFDIACGNKAVRLDCDTNKVRQNIYREMNEIQKHISFGIGRNNKEEVEHELFNDPLWDDIDLLRELLPKARSQLGTVGSGNHYVDVFIDDNARIWVGVHFGSRFGPFDLHSLHKGSRRKRRYSCRTGVT